MSAPPVVVMYLKASNGSPPSVASIIGNHINPLNTLTFTKTFIYEESQKMLYIRIRWFLFNIGHVYILWNTPMQSIFWLSDPGSGPSAADARAGLIASINIPYSEAVADGNPDGRFPPISRSRTIFFLKTKRKCNYAHWRTTNVCEFGGKRP